MARPPTDPEIVQIALDFARTGMSHDDISAQMRAAGYRVSAASVGNWARKAGIRDKNVPTTPTPTLAAPPVDQPPPAAPPPDDDDASVDDQVRSLRKMQRELRNDADTARRVGNMTAAQRAMSAAAALAPVIARLTSASRDERDTLRVSRSDLEAARQRHRERVRALMARPLLCAHCGRALSVQWAGASEPQAPEALEPAEPGGKLTKP